MDSRNSEVVGLESKAQTAQLIIAQEGKALTYEYEGMFETLYCFNEQQESASPLSREEFLRQLALRDDFRTYTLISFEMHEACAAILDKKGDQPDHPFIALATSVRYKTLLRSCETAESQLKTA